MKIKKTIITLSTAVALGGVYLPLTQNIASASEVSPSSENVSQSSSNKNSKNIYLDHSNLEENKLGINANEYFKKVSSIYNYLSFQNNKIQLNISENRLKTEFYFSDQDIKTLNNSLKQYNSYGVKDNLKYGSSKFSITGTTVHISANELKFGSFVMLSEAAAVGPAALGLALTTVATMFGGPVATVITSVMSLIYSNAGGMSLGMLCATIAYANVANKGIAFGLAFAFPPIFFTTE